MSSPAPLHRALGLTDTELESIREVLGREPNSLELALYGVMWSEHCSYKSSRIHLRRLPTEAPHVLVGPGATIAAGASIIGPTVIGHDTVVGAGTTIDACIIWEEARIGAAARITRSILGAYAGIGDRATVTDAVLGNGAEVEEGHSLEAGASVMPGERV